MQQAIDTSTFERVAALGRMRGRLTNRDLERMLPTGRMNAQEIAQVIVQLEEVGIPVELEESLLAPAAGQRQIPPGGATIIPFPERPGRPRPQAPRPTKPAQASTEANGRAGPWAMAPWVAAAVLALLLAGALTAAAMRALGA